MAESFSWVVRIRSGETSFCINHRSIWVGSALLPALAFSFLPPALLCLALSSDLHNTANDQSCQCRKLNCEHLLYPPHFHFQTHGAKTLNLRKKKEAEIYSNYDFLCRLKVNIESRCICNGLFIVCWFSSCAASWVCDGGKCQQPGPFISLTKKPSVVRRVLEKLKIFSSFLLRASWAHKSERERERSNSKHGVGGECYMRLEASADNKKALVEFQDHVWFLFRFSISYQSFRISPGSRLFRFVSRSRKDPAKGNLIEVWMRSSSVFMCRRNINFKVYCCDMTQIYGTTQTLKCIVIARLEKCWKAKRRSEKKSRPGFN